MAKKKDRGLAMLGVVAVLAIAGLVLLFSSQITGNTTFPSNRGPIPSLMHQDACHCSSCVHAETGPQWRWYSSNPDYLCDEATQCCYNKKVKVEQR